MPLNEVEQLYRSVYQDVETRLEVARTRVENLRRMEDEYVTIIGKRAQEDKEAIIALFENLRREEEETVKKLQMQIDKTDSDGNV